MIVQQEGNRSVERKVKYYNLDMIISLGYRIKSKIATNFRKRATERLKEYMIQGFALINILFDNVFTKINKIYVTILIGDFNNV